MENAREEENPNVRKELYKRAEQILCEEECAVVPIYYETYHYLVKPRVKGWYNMAIGGQHIRNWKLEE
jgi:oligopeptide transport system substrate-binding protein